MIGGSTPKLLQEAGKIKKALEKISATLPAGISAADMAAKITALENCQVPKDCMPKRIWPLLRARQQLLLS